MMSHSNNCSVVIPVYNSEQSLTPLISELANTLPKIAAEYEAILVNDGSKDRSWEVICDLTDKFAWVSGINLMRNYGQHNALLSGIRKAQYPIIFTMDDDLQHPPEEMSKLLNKLEEGYDVVYGTPQQEQHNLWRNLASQITKYVLKNAMGEEIARNISAFRVFRTKVREGFASYSGPFVSIDVLLTWGTTRFAAVQVRHEPRQLGTSNYTIHKLIVHAINMITGFSAWPLQVASTVGFLFTVFGIFVFLYVVIRYLIQGGSVPGFPFLASTIAIFSGIQLFILGMMGEYLSRMHFRLMDKPSYVIREHVGQSKAEQSETPYATEHAKR